MVLVFDHGTLTGYVNNQKMGEVDTGFTTLPPHSGAIGIGQMRNASRFSNASGEGGDGRYFDGTIDNVSLDNGVLTADAVSDRYIASLAPIAQWSLGETTGTVADNSGTLGDAVNGTYSGAPTQGVGGLIEGSDGAVEFDGVDDGITIPNHDEINLQSYTQRTVELWFNADTLDGRQVLRRRGNRERLEIDENAPFGAVMGSVAIDNPAAGNAYEIVDASHNGVFSIDNQGQIRVGAGLLVFPGTSRLNYEGVSEYSLQVRVTDDLGQTYTKEVLIGINDLNEAPDIVENGLRGGLQVDLLSAVSENATAGTVVTDLSVADDDETNLSIDDTLVYLFKKTANPTLHKIAKFWQDEKKLGSSKVSWNLLDLGLGGEINLKAKYELTFDDITGTLYVENGSGGFTPHGTGSFDELTGQFADVEVGNDGNRNGKLDYYIDFGLVNPELNTKMDLLVGDLTLDLGLLKGRADINAGFFKEKFKFSAFEDTFKLGSVNQGFNILNQTIDLDEFSAATYRGAIDLV